MHTGNTCTALLAALACAHPAWAQQPYPSKPLKMIMSFPAGGPTDILGRLLGQKLTESWAQNVVIDNRPGGGGVIGASLAVKSPADGYTMYLGGITTLVLAPFLHKNLPYDPLRDFLPVSQTTLSPLLLMTHPTLPAKSVAEFLALAKARLGQINYASSGPGGSGHLAGELFKSVTHKLSVEIARIMKTPGVLDRLAADGTIPVGNTPEEFLGFIKAEQRKWSKVVLAANITID